MSMSSHDLADAMSETLTPQEAARAVAVASRYEEALRQRTEGVTAMVWGLTIGGMYSAYSVAGILEAAPWVFGVVWIPWIAAGSLLTFALWRSAALAAPRLAEHKPSWYLLRVVGFALFFSAVFGIARPDGPLLPLALVGGIWALMAAINLFGSSPMGRRHWFVSGVLCVVAAGILALLKVSIDVAGMTSIILPSVLPFAFGLYQTLRG